MTGCSAASVCEEVARFCGARLVCHAGGRQSGHGASRMESRWAIDRSGERGWNTDRRREHTRAPDLEGFEMRLGNGGQT